VDSEFCIENAHLRPLPNHLVPTSAQLLREDLLLDLSDTAVVFHEPAVLFAHLLTELFVLLFDLFFPCELAESLLHEVLGVLELCLLLLELEL